MKTHVLGHKYHGPMTPRCGSRGLTFAIAKKDEPVTCLRCLRVTKIEAKRTKK